MERVGRPRHGRAGRRLSQRERTNQPPLPNVFSFICRLAFHVTSCLHRDMPVDDDQASGSCVAPSTQNGTAAFTTTHWSVVLAAQGPSPAAEEALEKLCRTYWRPIYGFVRRQGVRPEEAKDLTQGFFALLLERRDFDAVRKEKGRLRSYLLTSLKHFLTNERNRAMAIKRGEGQQLIPLEDLRERERAGFDRLRRPKSKTRRGWYRVARRLAIRHLGRLWRAGQ